MTTLVELNLAQLREYSCLHLAVDLKIYCISLYSLRGNQFFLELKISVFLNSFCILYTEQGQYLCPLSGISNEVLLAYSWQYVEPIFFRFAVQKSNVHDETETNSTFILGKTNSGAFHDAIKKITSSFGIAKLYHQRLRFYVETLKIYFVNL